MPVTMSLHRHCVIVTHMAVKCMNKEMETRKLSYRKDGRAMRPMSALKIFVRLSDSYSPSTLATKVAENGDKL